MSAAPLAIEIICTCFLAAFLLHRYGDLRKQHILTTIATFVAWYFSFLIVFVLPLDVSSTFYRQCMENHQPMVFTTPHPPLSTTNATSNLTSTTEKNISAETHPLNIPPAERHPLKLPPGALGLSIMCVKPVSHVPDNVLPALWHVVYWTSQILTWIILPMMQSYSTAGEFNVGGKIKRALIDNAIYYGTFLAIFGVCLIYVVARPDIDVDADKLKIICITASNTWGLFLLVLLLGYGLVEVPRTVWNGSKRGYNLAKTQFKIAKMSTEKTEAEENLEDVLDEIKKVSEKIRYNHPSRKHLDTILQKCPEAVRKSVKREVDDYEDYNKAPDIPSESQLVKLHKRVINATQSHHRTQAQWNALLEKAYLLEDVDNNIGSTDRTFKRTLSAPPPAFIRSVYNTNVEWYWKCLIKPWLMKGFAVVLIVFSFMVVWSECLFFIKEPVLSLFAVFINLAKQNDNYVYIEFASIITIAYLCFCAYYSIFQIRIMNWYYIAPHHQTDEYSLVFTGMMLCRLTPPMCLNFLGLIHLDSHITQEEKLEETSYTKIMGHMDVIAIVSDGFNIYFPIAIVVLCVCTYFSLGSRFLHCIGFQQFIGDDEMAQELVDEGRQIVKREKRRLERKLDSEERRREWTERFGSDTGSSDRVIGPRGRGSDNSRDYTGGRGRYTVPRSPDESDTTELLKEAEPIDYTGETTDPLDDYSRIDSDQRSYQSSVPHSSRFGSTSTPRSFSKPPKGIFDDV
ncbi:hypothetical protein FSP39_013128 [Pinctada imbricata]|uniref:Uncharacterized protein n=1 Tax=Pinctada imbricata TaxID=66713 RepID=A0AA89BPI8_PINIB|nr:hypothetical protein FSP39_013128 [Pinctada imbricata]